MLHWILKGFKDTIDSSGGSQIVDTLTVTSSDLLDGHVVPKIQAELLRFPQANWIKSPYTYVTTIGIAPALANRSSHINVMGGEGFAGELDLIRKDSITATNAISSDWAGWAAVDTMNSVFLHKAPVDSGIGWTLVDLQHNLPPSGDWTTANPIPVRVQEGVGDWRIAQSAQMISRRDRLDDSNLLTWEDGTQPHRLDEPEAALKVETRVRIPLGLPNAGGAAKASRRFSGTAHLP